MHTNLTRSNDDTPRRWRKPAFHLLAFGYVAMIFGLPAGLAATGFERLQAFLGTGLATAFSCLLVACLHPLVAGVLSVPHQRWIRPMRIETDIRRRPYFHRRLYGLCWTSLYYATPIYWLVLTIPWLKAIVFRLFGYRGALRFTVYPDTWIRDLPMLEIGEGAYLSNKATIGTNMILHDRSILVDFVTIEAGVTIGHAACIAPGSVCEIRSQVGVGALVGMRCRLGADSEMGPGTILFHGASLGREANLQAGGFIGGFSKIGDGVVVPPYGVVRARARVKRQDALDGALCFARGPGAARREDSSDSVTQA